MGKFQRSKVTGRTATGGGSKGTPTYTVSDLLQQANQAVDRFGFELAHQFVMRALSMEPQNLNALESAGSIEVELELFNEAKEVKDDSACNYSRQVVFKLVNNPSPFSFSFSLPSLH